MSEGEEKAACDGRDIQTGNIVTHHEVLNSYDSTEKIPDVLKDEYSSPPGLPTSIATNTSSSPRQSGAERADLVLCGGNTRHTTAKNDDNHHRDIDPERLDSYRNPLFRIQIISIILPLAAGVFIASLDITIIVTALPLIASHFDSSQIYTWTGSSYGLAHASTTTLWGMLSDIWGRKPILFFALGTFFAGSIICAFDDDVRGFLAGRALQGAGAGGLTTMANICISDLFSLRERGLYFGILSVVMAFACGIGPSLGGVFTERLTWRWCFYINLPICGVAFVLLLTSLPLQNPKTAIWEGLKAIDWLGTLLVISGTVMFLLGLTFGGIEYPWSSAIVVSLIVAGLAAIGLFLLTEWKLARYPMIPLGIFRSHSGAASFAVCFSHGMVLMGVAFYIPLYFQAVLATGPLLAGVYVLPYVISVAGAAAFTGIYIQRTGKYMIPVYLGLSVTIMGSGLMIDLDQEYNWAKIVLYQIAAGIGLGINFEPALISLQAATQAGDIAAATSTFAFVRSISTAISMVIGGVVFQNQMQDKANVLLASVGKSAYTNYQGSDVLANVYVIDELPQYQQRVIRNAIHDSLSGVWIMYTAFAGLGAIAGAFLAAHPLSNIHRTVVLGLPGKRENVNRRQSRVLRYSGDYHPAGLPHIHVQVRTHRKERRIPRCKRSDRELTTAQILGLEPVEKRDRRRWWREGGGG